jgi:hypothetical protein
VQEAFSCVIAAVLQNVTDVGEWVPHVPLMVL